MKRRVGLAGFTIVETMIVLAVTGALFVAIAATLAGRQRSNEFTQSINDVRAQIQQVVTETKNGFYANAVDFACSAPGGTTLTISNGSTKQGEHTDCVFLGKILQFTDTDEVYVYPVAGIRTAADIASAHPTVIRNGLVDQSTDFKLKYGLTAVKMRANGSDSGAFGVLSSLDSTTPGQSGDQLFDIYALTNVHLGDGQLDDSTDVLAAAKNPSQGVQICFKSGGTNQYGLVTVGNNSSQLSVDLKIMDTICW